MLAGCSDGKTFGGVQPETPGHGYAMNVADAAMTSGVPEMAARVTELILQRAPRNVPALVGKGDALYAMGELAPAQAAYKAAVAVDPASVGGQIGLGRTLVRTDPAAAEAAFIAALKQDPRNATALNNLGIARDMEGHHAEAQEAYHRALGLEPEMTEAEVNLGMSLALSGHAPEAVAMLQPLAAMPEAKSLWKTDSQVAQAMAAGTDGPALAVATAPVTPVMQAAARQQARAPLAAVPMASLVTEPLPPRMAEPSLAIVQPPATKPAIKVRMAGAVKNLTKSMHRKISGWLAQLGSLNSKTEARRAWRKLEARAPAALTGHAPTIAAADVDGRTYWRLRTGGFTTHAEAARFCQGIEAAGSDCWAL